MSVLSSHHHYDDAMQFWFLWAYLTYLSASWVFFPVEYGVVVVAVVVVVVVVVAAAAAAVVAVAVVAEAASLL